MLPLFQKMARIWNRLKSVLVGCAPHGFVETRRLLLRLRGLGLVPSAAQSHDCEAAVDASRFDLWPLFLRHSSDWILIDVGANDGDFIRAATQLSKPAAVVAFEPLPTCQKILAPLLASIPGGQLVRAAAGARAGEVELNCTCNTKMSSVLTPQEGIEASYARGDYTVVEKMWAPMVRLDDVIEPNARVGLLKIDVQGYEIEVLHGATRTLGQTEALLIEVNYTQHYNRAVAFDELHAFLNMAGFHLYGISAPYGNAERPLWADAMYVHSIEPKVSDSN